MSDTFTVFVDESGEAGITKVRTERSPGASPYMTLGAVIIRDKYKQDFREHLSDLSKALKSPKLHCSELKHEQKVYFARNVGTLKLQCFGVMSRKETLGWYQSTIDGDSKKYYNKCAQYLLERVGLFMKTYSLEPEATSIVFEEGNFDYQKMRNLISTCQQRPLHSNAKLLQHINPQKITTRKKSDEPILRFADLVAHALYKCVDKSEKNFNIPEPPVFQRTTRTFFQAPGN